MAVDIYRTAAAELDSLVINGLQPPVEFVGTARRALGSLGAALRERGGRPSAAAPTWRVLKIAKGGSAGRGTALRGGCDSELVIFLNCFKSYKDQKSHHTEILKEMQALLESWWQNPVPGLSLEFPQKDTPGVLQFRLASADRENWMDVSLVPAFDALGQLSSSVKPKPQVYSALLDSGCQAGEHAACFSELRRNFVNTRPAKLKHLILLVKHWFRQVCSQTTKRAMPPAYALELLTIYAWEQGCGKDAFSLAQGLRTVLSLIQQYRSLCVFWTINYDFEDPAVNRFLQHQLERPRPVILDPADPTWDVGNGAAWHWDLLAQEAESCYDCPCFLQAAGGAVQPWEVPGLPRAGRSGLDLHIPQDPVQRTPNDVCSSLDAVHPRTGSRQPSFPAPAPSTPRMVLGLSQIPAKELDRFIHDHLKPSPEFQKQMNKAIDVILSCLREKCAHKASRVSKPALLYHTPAMDLDKFISDFLQPDRQFLAQVNKAVDTICSFLRENCFRNSSTRVLKVVKGGSSAKGTALGGRSDADVVVFLSCFSQFTEQGNRRAEIISEIRNQLEACQREKHFEVKFKISKQGNPRVLKFSLTSQTMLDQSVDFDVLPAFDALGQLGPHSRPHPQVYVDLIRNCHLAGEYSSCFTELQRDFIISRPTKLKSLIRLVKHWYQQCKKKIKEKGSLPPQHGLELLTVYAWEQGEKGPRFNMAEGFRTVLELVTQYHQLRVYWTINYDYEDKTIGDFLKQQLQKTRPIILDPADPTGNLGPNARWDLLAEEAAACISALCCMGRDGTPIQPWPVKAAV